MNRQNVEAAVSDLLGAQDEWQAAQMLIDLGESFHTNRDPAVDIDVAYDINRSQQQTVRAAIGELAMRNLCGGDIAETTRGHDRTAEVPYAEFKEVDRDYPTASPSLRKLLHTLYGWFGAPYDRVFKQAEAGELPHAAIVSIGADVHEVAKWLRHAWTVRSARPAARSAHRYEVKGHDVHHQALLRDEALKSIRTNVGHAAAMIIGRGVAHDRVGSPLSKGEFVSEQFEQMAALMSAITVVSAPIMREKEALLDLYSLWENGVLDYSEFLNRASELYYSKPDGQYHRALEGGRWSRPGFCAADVAFVEPQKLDLAQSELLKMSLGSTTDRASFGRLLLAGTGVVAASTIFVRWPEYS